MSWEVRVGDCLDVLATLEPGTVQTCITSPPYWGLRDYGHPGQLGLEPTPEEYVARLVEVFRGVRRVLRDDGTLWINLGDSYATGGRGGGMEGDGGAKQRSNQGALLGPKSTPPPGLKPKDLVGIPWRVAFALQADGWTLRSDIVWSKPNPMPESVTDRPTKAHEYLFMLSNAPRYYYDAEAIREPDTARPQNNHTRGLSDDRAESVGRCYSSPNAPDHRAARYGEGRNRRSVWTIPTQPFPGAHFAVMPPALVEPCILAGTSGHGACPKCGAPWHMRRASPLRGSPIVQPGWAPGCTCNAGDPVPQLVLDPFAGASTVGVVCRKHQRRFLGIELNEEYARMARGRLGEDVTHELPEGDAPLFQRPVAP